MKERPVIMTAESVRAILDDRKTQTRRLMAPQPDHLQHHEWRGRQIYEGEHRLWCWKQHTYDNLWDFGEYNEERKHLAKLSPYGAVGARLWVKEAVAIRSDVDAATDPGKARHYLHYRSDYGDGDLSLEWHNYGRGWRSPIFMPRWASRLTLEIVEVRVQLLQEISEDDARAEGCKASDAAVVFMAGTPCFDQTLSNTARGAYAVAWDAINGARRRREELSVGDPGYTVERPWRTVVDESARWSANPFVWAITFRRIP